MLFSELEVKPAQDFWGYQGRSFWGKVAPESTHDHAGFRLEKVQVLLDLPRLGPSNVGDLEAGCMREELSAPLEPGYRRFSISGTKKRHR
jgi:hypothetical protein